MAKDNIEALFVSPFKLAKLLGVASSTIYKRIHTGAIPHKRLGSRILVPMSYVKELQQV